jgi:CBS domain-containing protein/anti-sigma regulatory factor (Ser/Thr protein kinase)
LIDEGRDERSSLLHALAFELKVKDAMISDVIKVSSEMTMSELTEIFRETRISGAPVVDGGRLVGLISIEDLIRCLKEGRTESTIEKWMTRDVEYLNADDHLPAAISKFNRTGFGRFPVMDRESGALKGILTKGDIIRGLLRRLESKYLEEEIHRYRASHIFEDIVANKTTLNLQYDVSGQDFTKAGESSSNFKKTLTRLGIPPPVTRRVSIASYEAEMNIVVFTGGGKITATITHDRIGVTAEDKGPGIPDIDRAMTPGYSTAPDWVKAMGFGAGMGLCNIKKCSDEMSLYSEVGKGTILEFVVMLNGCERKSAG